MGGTTDQGVEVSGDKQEDSVPVGMETISVLLRNLVQRLDVLEQSQRDPRTREDAKRGRQHSQAPKHNDQEDTTKGTSRRDTDQTELLTGENLLQSKVEFRQKIYIEDRGDFTWVSMAMDSEQNATSKTKPFRHDTDDKGQFIFSVSSSAKIYRKLLELCPPSNDGQVNLSEDRLVIEGEYPLLHCKKGLKEYGTTLGETELDKAIRSELKVLEQLYESKGRLKDAQNRLENLVEQKKINFESLKGLFHRGQLVVFRELRDEWAVARINMVTTNDLRRSYLGHDSGLELQCTAIDFDGKNFRSHMYRKEIPFFAGNRNITELPVYPLDYSEHKQSIIESSIESGRNWWKLHKRLKDHQVNAAVMQYTGYCETFGEDGEDEDDGGKGSQLASRVVVDPRRFPDRLLVFTEDNEDPFAPFASNPSDYNGAPENNPLVLCPERVLAHSLSDNEWYYVAMSRLQEPVWTPDAWSFLVQPASAHGHTAKSIDRIKRLAEAHKQTGSQDKTLNNLTGKGKGLTFLIHGPPGVGKTLLAECLSEEHRRPLYRINLGKLVAESNWESKIEEIFRQAHFWDAMLLVDEAEVILAERTQESMQQSAWVAVFLRKIEYFEGIIFLTTNLIHMIDPAFISRVNLGLKFPALDFDTRHAIWQKVLKDTPPSNKTSLLDPDAIKRWAKEQLNGRQIRNVIHSARLLALPAMDGTITAENIDDALKDVVSFMGMIEDEKKEVDLKYMSHWS